MGLSFYGDREETHPSSKGGVTLDLLAACHYGRTLDVVSDGSLQVGRILDVTTRVITSLVVHIIRSISTNWIIAGQMRVVEIVLEGSPVA